MCIRGAFIHLKNGDRIAYDEYGSATGTPVIFCHGWPSSRSMAEITDNAARELEIRIISPDRPGIRDSTLAMNRKLLDWPPLLSTIARHLSLPEYRLLGVSGGAPYAYAAAWALPEQVKAIAIVSGAPPIAELKEHGGLLPIHRRMLALHSRWPTLSRRLFGLARPFALLRPPPRLRPLFLRLLQPCDAAVLRDSAAFDACFESARQAWRGSAQGVIADAEIYARSWGFPIEEIRVPIRLWHGTKDRTFAYRLAEQVSARFPTARLRLIEGAGHYSLPIRHMHEILSDLIATPSTPSH